MSRSDHNRSRKAPGQRGTIARRQRSYRRQWAAWRHSHDHDDTPISTRKGEHSSMCGYGCCW